MKLIIAHLPHGAFESVRDELLDLGVTRMTVMEVHSSGPQSAVTLQSRAATLQSNLRSEMRLECVVSSGRVPAVVDVLRMHGSTRWALGGRIAVIDLDQLHEDATEDDVAPDDPRREPAEREVDGGR